MEEAQLLVKPKFRNQVLGAAACGMVMSIVGTVLGYTGPTLPDMMHPSRNDALKLSEDQAAIFVSILSIGSLIGSLSSAPMGRYLGQRVSMLVSLPPMAATWITMSLAQTFWLLAACRFVQGILIGTSAGAALTLASEICSASVRGRILGSMDLCRFIGYLFIYVIGSTQLSWRSVSVITGFSTVVLPFIILLFMHDSPRWLATKGDFYKVKESLIFFRGNDFDVDQELGEIINDVYSSEKKGHGLINQIKMLKNKNLATIFFALLTLNVVARFNGATSIASFSVVIFDAATQKVDPYLTTIMIGVTRIFGCGFYTLLADKFRRKVLFLLAHGLSAICILVLAICFSYADTLDGTKYLNWTPMIAGMLYNVFFGISDPVVTGFRSELFPTSFRMFGIGMVYTCYNIGTFAVHFTFLKMVSHLSLASTFYIYTVFGIAEFFIVFTFLPETKGKSLEEINVMEKKDKRERTFDDNAMTKTYQSLVKIDANKTDHSCN